MHRRPVRNRELLKQRLDELVATFDVTTITPDPLEVVLSFDAARDREVAGLLAAAFAYGRADIVVRNVRWILARMEGGPYEFLRNRFPSHADAMELFRDFSHRFHKREQLVPLLRRISLALRMHGSLGELFATCYDDGAADIAPSLERFVNSLIAFAPADREERRALEYLLPSPKGGSACKRMNLYLRWMVRSESPDCGLWTFVDPAKLVIPLDTHVHRISAFLGLSQRKSADWKAARQLTDELAKFDRRDPVRYDFAICRLGILDRCSARKRKENCDVCQLRDVCRFPLVEKERKLVATV